MLRFLQRVLLTFLSGLIGALAIIVIVLVVFTMLLGPAVIAEINGQDWYYSFYLVTVLIIGLILRKLF